MTESAAAAPLSLEEARKWIDARVDEVGGSSIGQVHGFFVDAESGKPSWLIAKLGRVRGSLVAIPLGNCAAGGGKVWVAHEREVIRSPPVVDPSRPLLREHELTISAHYGIGEKTGRTSDVASRKEGSVTSQPA